MEDRAGTSKSSDSSCQQNGSNLVVASDFEDGYFAVVPLSSCPHLAQVQDLPPSGIDAFAKCNVCNSENENWLCLTCYKVNCGRYIQAHAAEHFESELHPMALSMADLSAWCYQCEAYVHNEKLLPMKNAAHTSKFGESLPNNS
uniref:UBP-type domain-containing protein n=1 Tax=Acrobeloides nanus TaxID=290746 RepID=A0A914D754_9BILA